MPSSTAAVTPVRSAIPARASSSATAADAAGPSSASGSGSGVTTMTSAGRPMPAASPAVISASSYAGSGHVAPAGTRMASLLRVALLEVAQEAAVVGRIAAGAPGHRARDAVDGARAGSEQERVVGHGPPAVEADLAGGVVDGLDGALDQLGARGGGDALERHAEGGAERERLGDGEGLVGEVGVGADEPQAGPVAGERAEGQEGFQSGDPAAGDHDVHAADHRRGIAPYPCGSVVLRNGSAEDPGAWGSRRR